MLPEEKLNKLIQQYSRIERFPKKYKDILNIDKPMRWILADEKDQYISIYKKTQEQKILDIDISSCFPTVCKYLFKDSNPKFVEDIDSQPTKLDKNIFIANTLKTTNYLKILNIISKMVILGYVFDRQDSEDISLLEFEKDGCLVFSNDINYFKNIIDQNIDTQFLEFVKENNFIFHIVEYDYYIRCNNTSLYWSDQNKTKIKGKYKHIPQEILKLYDDIFNGSDIDLKKYLDVYNNTSLSFIQNNGLREVFQKYYYCGDENKILTRDGKYEKYTWRKSIIDPTLYQKTFIFPIWVFQQRNLSGIT